MEATLDTLFATIGGKAGIKTRFDETQATDKLDALPTGKYDAELYKGELITSKSGTPGYKAVYKVVDGPHTGRLIFHDLWLTPAAMPRSKGVLAKLQITDAEQLEKPVPVGVIVRVRTRQRVNEFGEAYAEVKDVEYLRTEKPTADPFAPKVEGGVA